MIEHGTFIAETFKNFNHEDRHVGVKLETTWGTEACNDYFHDLLVNSTREEPRTGFDYKLYSTLILLYGVHVGQYGTFGNPLMMDQLNLNTNSLDKDYGQPMSRTEADELMKQMTEEYEPISPTRPL